MLSSYTKKISNEDNQFDGMTIRDVYIFIPSNIYIKSILLLLSYDLYTILYYNKSKFYDHKFVHKNFL